MRTSYELPLNNMMPLSHFKTLVKVQRINGIRLFTLYILYGQLQTMFTTQ